jgi:predicted amidohydrolase YtcJ
MPLPSHERGARRAVAAPVAMPAALAPSAARTQPAQTIYVGGDILTMKGPRPAYVQALAVRDGKTADVGDRAGAMRLRGSSTERVDPKGRTLLPGFIDAHGHFVYTGPVGAVPSFLASGRVVGPDERVSPYIALKAVTEMAAWRIEEEKTKGTLGPGKLADMVICGASPLKVPPRTIKDIPVLQTMKQGSVVWSAAK